MSAAKIAIVVVLLIIIAGAAYFYTQSQQVTPAPQSTSEQSVQEQNPSPNQPQTNDAIETPPVEDAVVIDLTARNFEFSQNKIEVKKGDTVTIKLTSTEGMHDWVVDEFNAKTDVVNEGESTEVTFVADQAGEFEYYCSVMQHRQMGMVGTLIVTE